MQESKPVVCNGCGLELVWNSIDDGYSDVDIWYSVRGGHDWRESVKDCPNCGLEISRHTVTPIQSWEDQVSCNNCGMEYKGGFEGTDAFIRAKWFTNPGGYSGEFHTHCTMCGNQLTFESTSVVKKTK